MDTTPHMSAVHVLTSRISVSFNYKVRPKQPFPDKFNCKVRLLNECGLKLSLTLFRVLGDESNGKVRHECLCVLPLSFSSSSSLLGERTRGKRAGLLLYEGHFSFFLLLYATGWVISPIIDKRRCRA